MRESEIERDRWLVVVANCSGEVWLLKRELNKQIKSLWGVSFLRVHFTDILLIDADVLNLVVAPSMFFVLFYFSWMKSYYQIHTERERETTRRSGPFVGSQNDIDLALLVEEKASGWCDSIYLPFQPSRTIYSNSKLLSIMAKFSIPSCQIQR